MTAPIWMAIPPEMNSALLSAGQGSGPLLAVAAQWQELDNQYTHTAVELRQQLAEVQANSWQETSATQYVAAHTPYLAWLEHASINSAVTATQHETTAAAYNSALAAMPTLEELAANRATHGVLLLTNLFGINAAPLTRNEADYVRMWDQAASTMATYQAITEETTSAIPRTLPAPPILAPGGEAQSNQHLNIPSPVSRIIQMIEECQKFFENLGFGPIASFILAIILLWLYDIPWYPYYASYLLPALPLLAPALSALSALSALALHKGPPVEAPAAPSPSDQPLPHLPVHQVGPILVAEPAPAVSATTAGSPTSNPASGTPAAASNPPSVPGISYVVPGLAPPGVSSGPKADTTSPDTAADIIEATAAARMGSAPARVRRTQRGKRRAGTRGYRDEFVEATAAVDDAIDTPANAELTSHTTSSQGAGPLGFTGTAPTFDTHAAGMVQLPSDNTSNTVPLLPTTWITNSDKTSRRG